jgi:DNA polymerase-3 subunit epsilon
VVHPTQDLHSLDSIAERLELHIEGRHTALGDAVVTAQIFLALITLLEERGIFTLNHAYEASQKTHYARLRY